MNLIEYSDVEMMMIDVADVLAVSLTETLTHDDRATLAVPGGTTPGPVFDALSAVHLDWNRVDIVLTDERRVPEDHPRSNTRLIRQRLLTGPAAAANFISILDDTVIDDILPISVLLLGMGADMHTASLFPGSPDLVAALAADAPAIMRVAASDGLEPRVTLTGRVLADAINTHVLITGAEKRAALDMADTMDPQDAPIKTILPYATIHWAP